MACTRRPVRLRSSQPASVPARRAWSCVHGGTPSSAALSGAPSSPDRDIRLAPMTTPGASTALLTDQYELTMLASALADGSGHRPCVFETFARRLPNGRRYGVVAGTARLLDAIT